MSRLVAGARAGNRVLALALAMSPTAVGAQGAAAALPAPVRSAIAEAASRFGLPEDWIGAVIAVESGGRPMVVSRAGAIGLMQLMPATFAELRARYGLGADPFQLRDNILAGTAYLRELLDRYGPRGMLAAYNAGPRRWEQHLVRGRPLPAETIQYLARLQPRLTGAPNAVPMIANDPRRSEQTSNRIFVIRSAPAQQPDGVAAELTKHSRGAPGDLALPVNRTLAPLSGSLFVPRSGSGVHP